MDDIIVLAKSHWSLRRAVKRVNQVVNALKLRQAPDKTFIGKLERGFDFLSYHFNGRLLTVAKKKVDKHALHVIELYEQLRMKKSTSHEVAYSLELHVKRWQRWAAAGLQAIKIDVYEQTQYRIVLLRRGL